MKTIGIGAVIALAATLAVGADPATCPAVEPGKVLLLPFEAAGPAGPTWIGTAVQQNLLAELSRGTALNLVTAPAGEATADPAKPLEAGRSIGAQLVVHGGFQVNNGDLRLTGQVLDVVSGSAKAGLKATGTLRDLFALEDTIAQQVRRAMPTAQAAAPASPDVMLQQPQAPDTAPLRAQRDPTYPGSGLQRAVTTGRLAPPPPTDWDYPSRYYWHTYGAPYYPPYVYPPVVYPYWPFWHHGLWSPSIVGPGRVGIIESLDFRKGFSDTQGFVPMTPGFVPMTVQNPPPSVISPPKQGK